MAFLPAEGYGNMFTYTRTNIEGDGFEVKHLAGTIMRQAFGELIFSRWFNQSKDAYGIGKGGTFTTPIFKNWGAPATVIALTSGTAIGIGSQETDSVSMIMREYGTGVGYETIGDWITNLDVRSEIVRTLGNHIGRMVNWLDYDISINTPFTIEVVAAGSYNGLLGTNRKLQATAYGELGMGGIAMAYDSFTKSLAGPVTDRKQYVMVANSETFRNLKQGSVFQNRELYNDVQGIRYQILGEYMGFIFVETEELLSKGTALAYAANAAGYGFGMPPRVYYYPDYGNDANRLQVWKTKFYRGQAPIWRNKGTALIMIRCKSAGYDYNALG